MKRRSSVSPRLRALALSVSLLVAAPCALAQTAPPQDVDYPGTLTVHVDATDLARRVFHATQTVPVTPGPLSLLYPQWLPGNHSPSGSRSVTAMRELGRNARCLASASPVSSV